MKWKHYKWIKGLWFFSCVTFIHKMEHICLHTKGIYAYMYLYRTIFGRFSVIFNFFSGCINLTVFFWVDFFLFFLALDLAFHGKSFLFDLELLKQLLNGTTNSNPLQCTQLDTKINLSENSSVFLSENSNGFLIYYSESSKPLNTS